MRVISNLEDVSAYYGGCLEEHGGGSRAVGWNQPSTQLFHFLSMSQTAGLKRGSRVLDVGCGLGDFVGFLESKGLEVEYTGVDICPALIEQARVNYPDAHFEVRDILEKPFVQRFDFVFCSGTLNLLLPEHESWLHAMIQAMYDCCEHTLVFNLLSAYHLADEPALQRENLYYFAWPEEIFRRCREISSRICLEHAASTRSFQVSLHRADPSPVLALIDALAEIKQWGVDAQSVAERCLDLGLLEQLEDFLSSLEAAPEVDFQLGLLALKRGQLDEARGAFLKAIQGGGSSPEVSLQLASIAQQQGKSELAQRFFLDVLKNEPSNLDALEGLSLLLILTGEIDVASFYVEQIGDLTVRCYLAGELQIAEAAYKEAILSYQRALRRAPLFAWCMMRIAQCYALMGNARQCLFWAKKGLLVEPQNPILLQLLDSPAGS